MIHESTTDEMKYIKVQYIKVQ